MKTLKLLSLALGVLILPGALLAHHGNAAFDSKNPLTLKGTVTEWFWANPHCILQFDSADDKGRCSLGRRKPAIPQTWSTATGASSR